MHGATLLDAADKVLRPCILWNDTRSHAEAAELDADPRFRETHRQHRVSRLHRAEARLGEEQRAGRSSPRCAKVLLPKDYLRLWLTGEHMSEMSDSAGTSWLDVGERRWSPELLAATELDERQMPRAGRGHRARRHAARRTRRRTGAWQPASSVAGGAGDNAASACGMGTVQPGQAFVSLGTSGVLFAANGAYLPNPESAVHTFCHALPEHLAPDGRHPVGDRFAQLAVRHHRQERGRPDRRTRRRR